MTKIHEIIPVEQDYAKAAKRLVAETVKTFTGKADHFLGQTREVKLFAEERQGENIKEHKELVTTVDAKLNHLWKAGLNKVINITLTKENSNTSDEARADVVVDGKIVLKNLPATALLALEKYLGEIWSAYEAIPTLEPGIKWVEDESASMNGVYITADPAQQNKTEMVKNFKVVYEATEYHPAQVVELSSQEPVGQISVTRTSGMVTPATKAKWLGKIAELKTAVKKARQRANCAEVLTVDVAKDIRDFIHE